MCMVSGYASYIAKAAIGQHFMFVDDDWTWGRLKDQRLLRIKGRRCKPCAMVKGPTMKRYRYAPWRLYSELLGNMFVLLNAINDPVVRPWIRQKRNRPSEKQYMEDLQDLAEKMVHVWLQRKWDRWNFKGRLQRVHPHEVYNLPKYPQRGRMTFTRGQWWPNLLINDADRQFAEAEAAKVALV